MENEKFFKQWRDLTKKEKTQAMIGYVVIAGVGVICYKAGKRSAENNCHCE